MCLCVCVSHSSGCGVSIHCVWCVTFKRKVVNSVSGSCVYGFECVGEYVGECMGDSVSDVCWGVCVLGVCIVCVVLVVGRW